MLLNRRAAPALFLVLALGCGGSRTMGDACTDSDQCPGEGTCLSGVCAGYGCIADQDCDNDHQCLDVGGVMACALPCEADEECAGEQSCTPQEEGGVCI